MTYIISELSNQWEFLSVFGSIYCNQHFVVMAKVQLFGMTGI